MFNNLYRKYERWKILMVNELIVRIAAERIMNGGLNPKTGNVYVIEDITNVEYRAAVEECIAEKVQST